MLRILSNNELKNDDEAFHEYVYMKYSFIFEVRLMAMAMAMTMAIKQNQHHPIARQ